MAAIDYHGFSYALIDKREAAPSDRPPTSPARPGYNSAGEWRPTADAAERARMSFSERWQHAHGNPVYAAERDRKLAERAEYARGAVQFDRYGRKINARGELIR